MNSDIIVCPHCGAENIRVAKIWQNYIGLQDAMRCNRCEKVMDDSQDQDLSATETQDQRHFLVRFLIAAAVLSGMCLFLNRTFDVLRAKDNLIQIIYEAILILLVSSILATWKTGRKFKFLTIWFGIFMIMIVGYSYRVELSGVKDKVLAQLVPSLGYRQGQDSISFPISSDGHFHIRIQVNGVPIVFLADTGASSIVLSPHDARKIGLNPNMLSYDRFFDTANGRVRGASIRIDDFRVGDLHLKDIGASVNEAAMNESLLGMTFFKKLQHYEVHGDILTLYWEK